MTEMRLSLSVDDDAATLTLYLEQEFAAPPPTNLHYSHIDDADLVRRGHTFNRGYGQFTIASDGSIQVPHGLGVIPGFASVEVEGVVTIECRVQHEATTDQHIGATVYDSSGETPLTGGNVYVYWEAFS